MRSRIVQLATALGAATVLAVAGCSSDSGSESGSGSSAAATDPVNIRVGIIKASACAPTTLWEKHLPKGSKVTTTYYTAPADQVTALLAGSIDVACTGLTIAIVANAQTQPIRVIAQTATKGTGVIVGTNSGINSVADLRGKTIGYAPNSIHDVVARQLLVGAGMNPGTDVKLVKVGLADMPTALCDKQVDAFVGNEPNASVAIIKGCGRSLVAPYDTPIGTINAGILTSQDVIDKKSNLVQNVVAAQAKAVDEIVANPGLVPTVAEAWGADRAATEKSLENLAFAWKIDDTFVKNYQELAVQLKAIGLVTKDVDVKPIVNDTYSKAVGSGGS
ncbi:ABC transporter substrate-binding protein [Dactylosporangium sp. NPDC050688]|uniref:ABC transporter substrate-binding protein n=1 Tax=Dactylosporangium sp. NPDC050688 TaxID=3157217 RepID=UPI0034035C2F